MKPSSGRRLENALRVLVVEDNPADAMLVGLELRNLSKGEFDVTCAGKIEDAIALLQKTPFDVALLDLNLPDSAGTEGFARIRTEYPGLPVVILTGSGDEKAASEAIRNGVQDYLIKGDSDGIQIARSIRYAIERSKSERRLQEMNETLEERVKERTAEADRLADRLRALAVELGQTEQRERRRLSSVLHDHIQQLLVAARMQIGLAGKKGGDPEMNLKQADAIIKEAVAASRSLAVELSPPVLHQEGLAAAFYWLASRMEEQHLFTVHVEADRRAEPRNADLRNLLFDAVRELLLNAVKHSGAHEARVSMRREDGCTKITVEDSGKGFDSEGFDIGDGGLGLFNIQQRLAHFGGRFEIKGEVGKGVTACLVAPDDHQQNDSSLEEGASTAVAQEPHETKPPGHVLRILLVDDHIIMRQGLASLLQFEKDMMVIGEAGDGEEGVEMALRLKPDVVIMDINMPKMDGILATRLITKKLPRTRVIGLSMHIDKGVAQAMTRAGAVGFVTKGGPLEDVTTAIRKCVSGN